MNTAVTVSIIAGSVFAVAAVWIFVTRDRSPVRWMRPLGEGVAHAIPRVELRADLATVQALGFCDRWSVAALVHDKQAERCSVCVRAVERVKHRHK